jgi:hypothetical protein
MPSATLSTPGEPKSPAASQVIAIDRRTLLALHQSYRRHQTIAIVAIATGITVGVAVGTWLLLRNRPPLPDLDEGGAPLFI